MLCSMEWAGKVRNISIKTYGDLIFSPIHFIQISVGIDIKKIVDLSFLSPANIKRALLNINHRVDQ